MSTSIPGPAYLVRTPRLVLRCWNPSDAPLLMEAITTNLDHLRPWMPWAKRAPDLQSKIDAVRRMRGEFDLGKDFVSGILDPDEGRVLGGTGLHTRIGPDGLEIGYWIDREHTRQGLAGEAAGALARVAFEIAEVKRVEIHCDPRNLASAGVARKLGFVHQRTEQETSEAGETRETMIWTLCVNLFCESMAADIRVEAYDAIGRRIL